MESFALSLGTFFLRWLYIYYAFMQISSSSSSSVCLTYITEITMTLLMPFSYQAQKIKVEEDNFPVNLILGFWLSNVNRIFCAAASLFYCFELE
ncbi:hypothetical protein DERF_003830 [Dermatophagoides farinae]|uniref:Uncharacterized protein n=1 Tax=Dermatophagoides farinae TaxID=6954 RepID=A0A922IFN8_DERFA|nr:hypothetical protein DERF_003830 [Dermatophagoides farinae]